MNQYTISYVETEMIDRAKETAVYEMTVLAGSIEAALAFANHDLPDYYSVVAVADERYY